MKFILGKKIEMTRVFQEDGTVVPVTKISAGPCQVTQVKSPEKDSYSSVQFGFEEKKSKNKKKKTEFRYKKEIQIEKSELKVGDQIDVTVFEKGDMVKVTGTSKGRGFQGVVKRHGFHGSLATHGHKDQLRMPGSIGATGPARVFKGVRMPGQMGNKKISTLNLEIIEVNKEKNELFVKGAVPGARNGLVIIYG
ncbi:MAG: 50S ribosomal protein L3 [Patescibacteria group bacterium]|nr:50S ribosomal protein L3 [Patescibacteria group bacterium]